MQKVDSMVSEKNFLRMMTTREKSGLFMNEVIREIVVQAWIESSKPLPSIRDVNTRMFEGKSVPLLECGKSVRDIAAIVNDELALGLFDVTEEYVRLQKPPYIKSVRQESCVCPYHLVWADRHEAFLSLFAIGHSFHLMGNARDFFLGNQHVVICDKCGPGNPLLRECKIEDLGTGRSKSQTQQKWINNIPAHAYVFHDHIVSSSKNFAQAFLCAGIHLFAYLIFEFQV